MNQSAVRETAPTLRLSWYAIATAAWVSFLLAPQLGYLNSPALFGPRGLSISLVVLGGALMGLLYARLMSAAVARSTTLDPARAHVLLASCHLPLIVLWLPQFTGGEVGGGRPHLPLIAVIALFWGVVTAVVLRRYGRPGAFRWALVFGTAAGTSLALSLAMRSAVEPLGAAVAAAVAWGLYLLASMVGWGALVNRALLPDERLDWGQRAAWGLAALVLFGGLLNLNWSISPLVLLTLLAVGIGALAADRIAGPHGGRSPLRKPVRTAVVILAVVVAAAGLLQLGASAAGTIDTVYKRPAFDQHDDLQAYLVFSQKMLELGSMGPEPFEARRMLSMGGQSFLQTLVLVVLPLRALHLVEMGVAPLILLGLVVGFGRRHRLDPRLTLLAALLVVALPHLAMRGNTSALLTGVVLMVSWFRLVADEVLPVPGSLVGAALIALTASGLCALKSTFIPAAVTFFLLTTVCAVITGSKPRREAAWALVAGGLVMLFTLPWMVSILESSGTLLYPIFGPGFYGGVFTDGFAVVRGDFAVPALDVLRSLSRQMARLLPLLVLIVFVRETSPRRPALALAAAAAVSVVLLVLMGDPEINRSLARYAFPVSAAALLALMLSAFRPPVDGTTRRAPTAAVVAVAVGLGFLLVNYGAVRTTFRQIAVNLVAALDGEPAVSEAERAAATALEEAMPGGGRLLATLERPFLLDFRRRQVFIMSLPGMAGLPPGTPIFEGGEAVAEYLLGWSIPYLAYGGVGDSQRLLNLTEERIRERYPRSKMRWVMLRYHQRYNRVIEELAASHRRLYEDGHTVLLDLAERAATFRPSEHPEVLDGFVDDVWTNGEGILRGIKRGPSGAFVVLHTRGWRPDAEDRAAVRLSLSTGGRELEMVDTAERVFVFRLHPDAPAEFDLVIRSSPLDLEAIGAAGPGPALGIDIDAVIITEDGAAVPPINTLEQPVATRLDPSTVWRRSGFFRDHNWTDGDATLDNLRWPVPEGTRTLVLSLHGMRPERRDLALPGVRVLINGIELIPDRVSGDDLVFRLYEGLREINRVRILSPTVSPRDLRGARDRRELGVPVRLIWLGEG